MGFHSVCKFGPQHIFVLLPLLLSTASSTSDDGACTGKDCNASSRVAEASPAGRVAGSVLLQSKAINKKTVVLEEVEPAPPTEAVLTDPRSAAKTEFATTLLVDATKVHAAMNSMLGNTALLVVSCVAMITCLTAMRFGARRSAYNDGQAEKLTETEKMLECALALDGHGGHSATKTTVDVNPKESKNLLNWAMNFDPDRIQSAKMAGFGGGDEPSPRSTHSEAEPDPETDSDQLEMNQ